MRSLIVLAVAALPAAASPRDSTTPVAIAVNPPFRWPGADAIAVSGYAGLSAHDAIRANVSVYDDTGSAGADLIALSMGDDGDEASRRGRIVDAGVAWMYFPRRLWSGFSLEAGVLRRARNTHVDDEFASPENVDTRSATYAGRVLVGWSWLLDDRLFLSIAAGASVGYERGTETTYESPPFEPMPTTQRVGRSDAAFESFLRLGVAFGL